MTIRALERILRRQGTKGALKPRTVQGGKVEPYQDQVVRKFGGGQIKTKK